MGISLYPDDVGTEGTIIMCDNRYSDMVYGIHFDNTILDGHSLDGKCPYGHGYNLTEEFIELIQDTEFDLDELYSKFY
ncbi:MAG: hypothetical protein RRZ64_06490 [Rikenellaceae bacterium]